MGARALVGAIFCAFILLFCAPFAAAQSLPPVEAFGRLPHIADAALSPDGTKVAWAENFNGQSRVHVFDLDANRVIYRGVVDEGDNLRGVDWADDLRVTLHLSHTFRPGDVLPAGLHFVGRPGRVEYQRNAIVNLQENRIQILTTDDRQPWADIGSPLIAPIEGEPGMGRMRGWSSPYAPRTLRMYRIDLDNSYARVMPALGANRDTIGYLVDDAGALAARLDSQERSNRWRLFSYVGDEARLLREDVSRFGEPIQLVGLMPDGRLGAIDRDERGEYGVLQAIDRSTGAVEIIFRSERGGISCAITDPWTRRVVGAQWEEDDGPAQHFIDPQLREVAARLAATTRFTELQIVSWSRDRRRFLVFGERGLDGGGYYLYTPADGAFTLIGGMRYPELVGAMTGLERQAISYPARDGVRIPAYLTLPSGPRRAMPLVLLVHGGPFARADFGFQYQAAFLASRGYAVLEPNFRGSSGYGRAWEEAGWGQWGGLMQTDVEDGVSALIRAGMVDASRVCIMGSSYGGYAALAGATLTPDRYACAISIAGVADLERMLRDRLRQYGEDSITADYWTTSIGHLRDDREAIRAVSPIELVDRVQIPVLLMHGDDDAVVPYAHSREMEERLRHAGKEVRLVRLRGDDHYLSDEATRIETLREVESFLAVHIGAR